ncbi:MAG: hypothetical protein CMF22_11990 [Idiomarinaceae bacterium]|nr:hypothetical protein [Idiomarinaceae bacterium]
MSPIQKRYNRALSVMRGLRVSDATKDIQKDIEFTRHEIESYGFRFYANHYIFDKVVELESLVVQLQNHKTTTSR